jgi:hexosaminidase
MPGHAHAAIQSMRMRAEAAGGVNNFLLSDPEDASSYTAVNEHKDTVVNPCLESTFRFIEHVLKALKKMHQVFRKIRFFAMQFYCLSEKSANSSCI